MNLAQLLIRSRFKAFSLILLFLSTPCFAANRVTLQNGSNVELGTTANPIKATVTGAVGDGTGAGSFTTIAASSTITETRTPAADSGATNNGVTTVYTVPVDTTGTNTHQPYNVSLTVGNASGGTNTVNGYNFANYTGDAQVNVNAVNIGTSDGLGTANAINIGAGWDADIKATGLITTAGTITDTSTTTIGWAIVAGANTACTTTCTNACVFGEDTAVVGTIVACADATADLCLCAGAS